MPSRGDCREPHDTPPTRSEPPASTTATEGRGVRERFAATVHLLLVERGDGLFAVASNVQHWRMVCVDGYNRAVAPAG